MLQLLFLRIIQRKTASHFCWKCLSIPILSKTDTASFSESKICVSCRNILKQKNGGTSPPLSDRLKRFLQFRQHGKEIADEAVIGDLEDRRFLVLVDGDDDA